MTIAKHGLKSVRTMGCLVDLRRARTPAGALMELSGLANEKQRLGLELERCQRRQSEIDERLAEIVKKEARLYEFVMAPPLPVVQALFPDADFDPRLRATELRY